jgi:hypothetical protein
MERINITKTYCKHICKYHNVPHVLLLRANIITIITIIIIKELGTLATHFQPLADHSHRKLTKKHQISCAT